MKNLFLLIIVVLFFICCSEKPLQRPDPDFDTSVQSPAFTQKQPGILFDEGHNNFHTTTGLYEPFARLMRNDGYLIKTMDHAVTMEQLNAADILVIANAKGTGDLNDTKAFTDAECELIKNWVAKGGSLLLIADHFPFGSAVENLADRFNIHLQKGMVEDSVFYNKSSNDHSQLEFSKQNGLLAEHPITKNINKVISFTGQSIQSSDSAAISFLKLSDAAFDLSADPKVTKDGNDTRVEVNYGHPTSAKGRSQGLALNFGKGKVVCLGEAAMLTAQKDRDDNSMGMNANPDNKILALNILHWLTEKQ
jgi:hypothetical protein